MSGPNPVLMERYGTAGFYAMNFEKTANMPRLLELLGPVGTAMLLRADGQHQERQAQEAVLVNELFRQLEAQKQHPVVAGLSGEDPAMTAQGRAVQGLRDMQAYQDMLELQKQGTALTKKAFGGSLLSRAATGARGMLAKLPGAPLVSAPGGAIAKSPAAGFVPKPQGAAQAAVGAKRPLIGMGTKVKVLGAGLGLGAAYTGYKGMQAARNYMMQPTYASTQWGGKGRLPAAMNEFGYAK